MKGKLVFILGAAVGYVLGARAGRERYEQIKRGAQAVWETPPVQRGAEMAREAVDVRVTELKSAAVAAGSQLLGAAAKRMQGSQRTTSATTATKSASSSAAASAKPAAKPAAKAPTKPAAKKASRASTKPAAKTSAKTSAPDTADTTASESADKS